MNDTNPRHSDFNLFSKLQLLEKWNETFSKCIA